MEVSNKNAVIAKMEVMELAGGLYFVSRGDRYAYLTAEEALYTMARWIVEKKDHHYLKSENQRQQELEARRAKSLSEPIELDIRKNKTLTGVWQ